MWYCFAVAQNRAVLTMLNKPDPSGDKKEPVVVKKYANRRLYNTETSTYVTLEIFDLLGRVVRTLVNGEQGFGHGQQGYIANENALALW